MKNTLTRMTTNTEYLSIIPQETSQARTEDDNNYLVIENDDHVEVEED